MIRASNSFIITIFQLAKDPSGFGTVWVKMATETFCTGEDCDTHVSLICPSPFSPVHSLHLRKHYIRSEDDTSFTGIVNSPQGTHYVALRFFTVTDAKNFAALVQTYHVKG